MNRREFLTGAAAVAGLGATGFGQAPAQPPAQGRDGARGGAAADAGAAARPPTRRRKNWRASRS